VAEPVTRSAFGRFLTAGRHGNATAEPGLLVSERTDLALASVIARHGAERALSARVSATWGIELPRTPSWTAAESVAFVWTGPGQWLALAVTTDGAGFEAHLAAALDGLASVCDQSDARGVLRLSGPRARDVLMKCLLLDLHERAFAPGHAAGTLLDHVGIQLWQLDEGPSYEIAAPRSYAGSLWHHIEAAGAEYGIEVA
jgi:sarcosine oxidase subunit gamma